MKENVKETERQIEKLIKKEDLKALSSYIGDKSLDLSSLSDGTKESILDYISSSLGPYACRIVYEGNLDRRKLLEKIIEKKNTELLYQLLSNGIINNEIVKISEREAHLIAKIIKESGDNDYIPSLFRYSLDPNHIAPVISALVLDGDKELAFKAMDYGLRPSSILPAISSLILKGDSDLAFEALSYGISKDYIVPDILYLIMEGDKNLAFQALEYGIDPKLIKPLIQHLIDAGDTDLRLDAEAYGLI